MSDDSRDVQAPDSIGLALKWESRLLPDVSWRSPLSLDKLPMCHLSVVTLVMFIDSTREGTRRVWIQLGGTTLELLCPDDVKSAVEEQELFCERCPWR